MLRKRHQIVIASLNHNAFCATKDRKRLRVIEEFVAHFHHHNVAFGPRHVGRRQCAKFVQKGHRKIERSTGMQIGLPPGGAPGFQMGATTGSAAPCGNRAFQPAPA